MKFFKRFRKQNTNPTEFDPEFLKQVHNIKIEKHNPNSKAVVIPVLRERVSLEYFRTSKLS